MKCTELNTQKQIAGIFSFLYSVKSGRKLQAGCPHVTLLYWAFPRSNVVTSLKRSYVHLKHANF